MPSQNPPQEKKDAEVMVELNLGDQADLRTLIDFVSQRLNVKILYDEQVAGKQVSIRAPGKIPSRSLLQLLESALKMKGLALVEADVPGWKRITPSTNLPAIAQGEDAKKAIDKFGPTATVTQAFVLKSADPHQLDQILKPFLTQPGANSIPLKEQGILIVTDYAANILRIAKLVELIDTGRPNVLVETYNVRNVKADALATQVNGLLTAKLGAQGSGRATSPSVRISQDARTNKLFLVGTQAEINDALDLAKSLDIAVDSKTQIYKLRNIHPERIERLVRDLAPPGLGPQDFRTAVDVEGGLLIVTGPADVHARVAELQKTMDIQDTQTAAPIKIYKIKNVNVADILQTVRAVQGERMPATPAPRLPTDGSFRTRFEDAVPGPNRPNLGPSQPLQAPPTPPAYRPLPKSSAWPMAPDDTLVRGQNNEPAPPPPPPPLSSDLVSRAQLSADENTNSLIVVGDPQVQQLFATLISKLDRPKPQVLVDAKIVILDTTDDFAMGVEISGRGHDGLKRILGFTSFGLSTVNPTTGALSLIPGVGFNGTMVNPETADVVLRAFSNHRRARVISAPRIAVSDNATGQLTSVLEVPFTSVNASQTVATTSFAGFADAGTTITVTPHIGEEDHLQLKFQISLNTFTGTGSDGIPPPRQTDEVQTELRVPDGHTVIIGGLNRSNKSQDNRGLPVLEFLPLAQYLLGNENRQLSTTSIFIFLRPIILRDDKFRDLKFLSDRDAAAAHIHTGLPESRPVLMKQAASRKVAEAQDASE